MDLSRICIEPRLRNPWEAIDLGIAMARAWWLPLQLSWLIPSAIVYLIACLIFPDPAWVALLVTWWLAPFWDRFPLMLASRALFDEPLTVRAVWREWRTVFKTDWFAWLTWRRFSPTRSFDMPVTVLEALRGEQRSRRLHVLHRASSSAAFSLTFICFCFIPLIVLTCWLLAALMVPQGVEFQRSMNALVESSWWARISNTMWYLALALVAPFYSVAGFALYISRRIELEGWDIEIRFRHLAERFGQSKNKTAAASRVATIVLPLLLLAGSGAAPPPVHAQDVAPSGPAFEAKQTIVEVLEGEDFNNKKIESGWRLKTKDSEAGFPDWLIWVFDALETFFRWFGPLFEFIGSLLAAVPYLLWMVLIVVLAYVVYRFRDALAIVLGARPTKAVEHQRPEVLFGLDLRRESLPEDVPGQVMSLWRGGKHREAVGLLYRATLSGLIHQFSFEFFDGYTEQECANLVRSEAEGRLSTYVQRLTAVWQHLAYAHRMPGEAQVSDLCSEWPAYFKQGAQGEG
ncbi:MAG: DUF4129 domain-containing protein [Cellvibrionaceae bacterium]